MASAVRARIVWGARNHISTTSPAWVRRRPSLARVVHDIPCQPMTNALRSLLVSLLIPTVVGCAAETQGDEGASATASSEALVGIGCSAKDYRTTRTVVVGQCLQQQLCTCADGAKNCSGPSAQYHWTATGPCVPIP